MPLTPFPIYDLRSGLQLDREPWIAPDQAWTEMLDCYVFRGRLRKRYGYTRFGDMATELPEDLGVPPDAAGQYTLHGSGAAVGTLLDSDTYGAIGQLGTSRRPRLKVWNAGNQSFVTFDADGSSWLSWVFSGADVLQTKQWAITNQKPYVLSNESRQFEPGRVPGTTIVYDSGSPRQQIAFDVDGIASGDIDPAGVCIETDSIVTVAFAAPAVGLVRRQQGQVFSIQHGQPVVSRSTTTMTGTPTATFSIHLGKMMRGPTSAAAYPVIFQETGGGLMVHFDKLGAPSGDMNANGVNFVDWESGTATVTYSGVPVNPVNVAVDGLYVGTLNFATGDYAIDLPFDNGPNDAVFEQVYIRRTALPSGVDRVNMPMLIHEWRPEGATNRLLVCDRRRLFEWDATDKVFLDRFATDFWLCEPDNFFSVAPCAMSTSTGRNCLAFANAVNILTYIDPTNTFREINTDWSRSEAPPAPLTGTGGGANYNRKISCARWIFFWRGRLILLDTTEGIGADPVANYARHEQRARWSKIAPQVNLCGTEAGGAGTWRPLDFTDCSTEERIISAKLVGDELLVWFEKSLWRLASQDDYRQPFVWQQIDTVYGSQASHSTVSLGREAITVADIALVGTDGRTERAIDELVPDIISDANPASLSQSYGGLMQKARLMLWTYPGKNDVHPHEMLALQYEDRAVSQFRIPMHCLGNWLAETPDQTWDQVEGVFDQDRVWDWREDRGGFAITLAGGYDQTIYSLLDQITDDGVKVTMSARTVRLNPYQQAERGARLARLGFVDLLIAATSETAVVVSFIADTYAAPWLTKTIVLTSADLKGREHVKKRILVNKVSRYHQIVIEHMLVPGLAVDAVIPWFEPAGEARPTL